MHAFVFAQQEQFYSQIATSCDVVLGKRENMIIHLTVFSVQDDTREADSCNMRYHDNSRPSMI